MSSNTLDTCTELPVNCLSSIVKFNAVHPLYAAIHTKHYVFHLTKPIFINIFSNTASCKINTWWWLAGLKQAEFEDILTNKGYITQNM